jgi:hypothetical protein
LIEWNRDSVVEPAFACAEAPKTRKDFGARALTKSDFIPRSIGARLRDEPRNKDEEHVFNAT